jgi:hypothetical protein
LITFLVFNGRLISCGAGTAPHSSDEDKRGSHKRPLVSGSVLGCDGRSPRATGRTAQLSTRIKPETVQLLRQLAARDLITMAEVIEQALDLYASR